MSAPSAHPFHNLPPHMLPLCVDLDDTLILTDTFFRQLRLLLRTRPWLVFSVIRHYAMGGRPQAKAWLQQLLPVDPATLPYRTELLSYLKEQKAAGRKLYLVSAANENIVKSVAEHVGLFDGAFGTNDYVNLKAKNKADFILRNIATDFVYAGDALADIAIWKHARALILCGKAVTLQPVIQASLASSRKDVAQASHHPRQDVPVEICFPDPRS